MKFPPEASNMLKDYVYLYRDPDTGVVFYVGRGKGNRAFVHLDDTSEKRKTDVIQRLRSQKKTPIIDVLRYSLSEDEAQLVEAASIDLLGLTQLTNQTRGFHKGSVGRISAKTLIEDMSAQPCDIADKVILIRINRYYREDMTPTELYDVTRGIWRVGNRSRRAEYAFAVFQGVVKEVYEIESWHPAGTTTNHEKVSSRREFVGHIAPDAIRRRYLGKSVRHCLKAHSQNPIVYVNF